MKTLPIAAITLLIGTLLGFSASHYLIGNERMMTHDHSSSQNSKEPLYWVAPMDPNYRRDRPGKSPMGMDLIPVYAEEASPTRDQPGTVHIDPAVENNLGVKTANVEFSKLSPRIETVGYIAFDESQLWQTNVRVSGWVEKLYINAVGEKVNKGDVLFTLYSPELIKAQEELLNAKRTGRDGLIQGATERLISLGVDRDQIRQLIRRGKASQTIEIKALANGVIASLNIREGGFLSPAQAVISAGPLEEVWVEAEVFERQAHWISKGSQTTMTLDSLPGREWQGEVDYVYPILDPKTRTLRMRLKFTNPNGELKPNMFANLTLQPISDSKVLTVPKSAVIRSGGMTRVVLAQGQGKYRSVRIKTGQEAGDKIEILQGLTLQDRIVTSAHFMLDSESSQRADLSRIHGIEAPAQTVWAKGEITDIMLSHQMLTLVHQPIPEWNWPGMTMNFTVAQGVDLHGLSQGQAIEFEMEKTPSDQYQIIAIKADDRVVAGEVWIKGDISMLMADFGMVTLSHLAVPEWNWEAGELNFSVGDEINLSDFKQGEKVQFLVARNGSDYVLKQLKEQGEQL
ncbi:efflux RND transporter periplasmic adaptor subunit [Vibrio cincinnatiensis]|uniref:efflux RND transporter periplasmic adaptor subunit n=1 Tax=Vibrio cincinnatiensis TaxID=675 RepID=UPI001EDEE711|nr:efflux RND transporter periplasmic adaptor subunit [Vibrio cincinnatiensis]MCG3765540.1 efflux RND transporter periplasmic adaptor subunit [Vibrio cincinnatiensis]